MDVGSISDTGIVFSLVYAAACMPMLYGLYLSTKSGGVISQYGTLARFEVDGPASRSSGSGRRRFWIDREKMTVGFGISRRAGIDLSGEMRGEEGAQMPGPGVLFHVEYVDEDVETKEQEIFVLIPGKDYRLEVKRGSRSFRMGGAPSEKGEDEDREYLFLEDEDTIYFDVGGTKHWVTFFRGG